MLAAASRWLLLTMLGSGLVGCAFFLPPEELPTPSTGTEPLGCGETRDVTGLSGVDSIPLDIDLQTNFELVPSFEPLSLGMRLSFTTDVSLERSLELWDPARSLRLVPGSHNSAADIELELLGTASLFAGSIVLNCSQPAENCFNLSDDDGDGLVDCADLNCAQDPGCLEDQEDSVSFSLTCEDDEFEVSTELGTTDDQRTLYRTHPGGADQPGLEFWGGAEIVVRTIAKDVTGIAIHVEAPGLLCLAEASSPADAEVIECEEASRFEAGEVLLINPSEAPFFLEPLGAGFDSLTVVVDCTVP